MIRDLMWLGKVIQRQREGLPMTTSELSRRSGVDRKTITRIETGENVPTLPILCQLAQVLGVSPDRLLKRALQNSAAVLDRRDQHAPSSR